MRNAWKTSEFSHNGRSTLLTWRTPVLSNDSHLPNLLRAFAPGCHNERAKMSIL